MPFRLVLASASPRRAKLLRAAGFTFETRIVVIDEAARQEESASAYVRRLAMEKSAAAIAQIHGPAEAGHSRNRVEQDPHRETLVSGLRRTEEEEVVVLGADTAVVVDGEILGKPRDDADAGSMLHRLSGRRHEVMTGVSLRRGEVELGRVETTAVYFTALSDADVLWYVASGEGRDKAGAYAIQGLASRFIPRIEGSYSNVVGLPVACVVELLRLCGQADRL